MTDVFLVSPPYGSSYGKGSRRQKHGLPPLGLASINAYVKSRGYSTKFIDLAFCDLSDEDVAQLVKRERPRAVGITAVTTQIVPAVRLAQCIKRAAPSVLTVLGGPHPAALPELSIQYPGIDLVVAGEGELAMCEILEDRDYRDILGLCWIEDGAVRRNQQREPLAPLDDVPAPDYDGLDIDSYRHIFELSGPAMPVMSGRGCPFRCNFCASDVVTNERTSRYLSPKRFVDHIEDLYNRYGVRDFVFTDETFVLKSSRIFEICDEILSRGLKFSWVCQTRVNGIDPKVVAAMKRAGCKVMAVGIESGDPYILETIGKGIKKDRVIQACDVISRSGILLEGFFILGLPHETPETVRTTIDFALKLPLDYAQFSMFIPLPGTPGFKMAVAGEVLRFYANDWDDFSRYTYPLVESDALSRLQLKKLHSAALRSFYFRPRMIYRSIRGVTSFAKFKLLMTMARDFTQILLAKRTPKKSIPMNRVTPSDLLRLNGALNDTDLGRLDAIAPSRVNTDVPTPAARLPVLASACQDAPTRQSAGAVFSLPVIGSG